MNNNLIIPLEGRHDDDEKLFYIGRLTVPISIDLSAGITLLVFLSESGDEELQIALNDKENATFNRVTKKRDRLKIPLDVRPDKYGAQFYIAKVHMNGNIRCHEGIAFMIFTSRKGSEEIQIIADSGNIFSGSAGKRVKPHDVEVIRRGKPCTCGLCKRCMGM